MNAQELKTVLDLHAKWLRGEVDGKQADLMCADLRNADLRGAKLSYAGLNGADLRGADLNCADLRGADLNYADLRGADLNCADLRGADISYADLRGADISYADLMCADLMGADLRKADLRKANLSYAGLNGAGLRGAKNAGLAEAQTMACPEEGSFIGFKKCVEGVVKLLIPEHAKRSSATGRKCRASEAVVLELPKGCKTAHSIHDESFEYRKGEIVKPHIWGEDRWKECAGGIHFYITRAEAEAHA